MLGACSARRGPSAPSSAGWDAYRADLGRRLVAANPNGTYSGAVPEPLLAIPVLEIDLNRDGSVRAIRVQRQPSQASDTVQLAVEAVRRAAPFGDVSHLPQPWRVSEVFLFRDDRRFKPRSLDP
jgi:protein TonB